MARPKKNGKYLNVCIQEEIYKKLEEFCLEAGQTKTIAVERALAQYIEMQCEEDCSICKKKNPITS